MGVIIYGYTDSHLDYFTRNLIVSRGDLVASSTGDVSTAVRVADGIPSEEPISVEDAKAHIRFIHDEEDVSVLRWIQTARVRVERDTGIALVPGTWRMAVHGYPIFRRPLRLPIWPVTAVTRFEYYTADGVLTVGPSPAVLLFDETRPTLLGLPDVDTDWPTDLRDFQPGIIEVTAGYATPDLVPADLIQAMLTLIDDLATHRGSSTPNAESPVPMGYQQWIESWILPAV